MFKKGRNRMLGNYRNEGSMVEKELEKTGWRRDIHRGEVLRRPVGWGGRGGGAFLM